MCDWEVSELLLAENCHGRLEGRAWNCKCEGFRDLSLPHPGLGPWGGRELGVANKEFKKNFVQHLHVASVTLNIITAQE